MKHSTKTQLIYGAIALIFIALSVAYYYLGEFLHALGRMS